MTFSTNQLKERWLTRFLLVDESGRPIPCTSMIPSPQLYAIPPSAVGAGMHAPNGAPWNTTTTSNLTSSLESESQAAASSAARSGASAGVDDLQRENAQLRSALIDALQRENALLRAHVLELQQRLHEAGTAGMTGTAEPRGGAIHHTPRQHMVSTELALNSTEPMPNASHVRPV